MSSMSLTLRTLCGSCAGPLPVGAVVPAVICPRCQTANTLTVDAWKRVSLAAKMASDAGMDLGASSGDRKFQLSANPEPPTCACGTAVPMENALLYANRGFVHCPGCGARLTLRSVPPPLAAVLPPGTTHLVAEDAATLQGAAPAGPVKFFFWAE